MKRRKAIPFEQGAVCAAQIVFSDFDEPVVAFEILKALGAADLDPRSVDEFDRPVLRAYQSELDRLARFAAAQ